MLFTHISLILKLLEGVLEMVVAFMVLLFVLLDLFDLQQCHKECSAITHPWYLLYQYPPTFPLSNSSSQGSLPLFRLSPSTTAESMVFSPPSQDFTAQGEQEKREEREEKVREGKRS